MKMYVKSVYHPKRHNCLVMGSKNLLFVAASCIGSSDLFVARNECSPSKIDWDIAQKLVTL